MGGLPKTLEELKAHFGGTLDDYTKEMKDFAEEHFNQFLLIKPGTKQKEAYCTFCKKNVRLSGGVKQDEYIKCPSCGHVDRIIIWKKRDFEEIYFQWWEKSKVNPKAIVCRGINCFRRRERDDMTKPVTEWDTDSASVFIYGKGGVMAYQAKAEWDDEKKRYYWGYKLGKVHGRGVMYSIAKRQKAFRALVSFNQAREETPFVWAEEFGIGRGDLTEERILNGELVGVDKFCRYKSWEWLTKMGLKAILEDYAAMGSPHVWRILNFRGKTVDKIFRGHLTKQDKAYLHEGKVKNILTIGAWQEYRRKWPHTNLKEVGMIYERAGDGIENIWTWERVMKLIEWVEPKKLLRYITKQEEKGIRVRLSDFGDYIKDCQTLEKDLTKKETLFPADFPKAHEHTSKEVIAKRELIKSKKWKRRQEEIENRYQMKDGNRKFLLLTPKSVDDLVNEGEHMHNCVGTYADRVARGECDILFLRKSENPEESYITIEIDPRNGTIRQAREKYNKDVESEEAKHFLKELEAYAIERMKEERRAANE